MKSTAVSFAIVKCTLDLSYLTMVGQVRLSSATGAQIGP